MSKSKYKTELSTNFRAAFIYIIQLEEQILKVARPKTTKELNYSLDLLENLVPVKHHKYVLGLLSKQVNMCITWCEKKHMLGKDVSVAISLRAKLSALISINNEVNKE